MKRLGLVAALLMCVGCVTPAPDAGVPRMSMHAAKSLPPVTPEQINDQNGHQVAQSLMEELDREQQQNLLTTTPR